VEVFGVNSQGTVWYRYQLVAGAGTWSDWRPGPSWHSGTDQMLSLAMVRGNDGRLNVFGATPSGQLWRMTQNSPNSPETWASWSLMTGSSLIALAAATDADGTIELVGLQADGSIWQRWQSGNSWSNFVQVPGTLTTVTLALHGGAWLELIGTDVYGNIYDNMQMSPNGRNNWLGWSYIPGGLDSVSAQSNTSGGVDVFGVNQWGYWKSTHNGLADPWTWVNLDENTSAAGTSVNRPDVSSLQIAAQIIGTGWQDQSTNEAGFEVQRRGVDGRWTVANTVATKSTTGLGGNYTWTDMSDLSGQCYRFVAYNHDDAGYSTERCGVRPDPGRFPQAVSNPAQQWSGFTTTNGGVGELHNTKANQDVVYENRTAGVSLGWGDANAWTFEAQGGPTLMKGQALALRLGNHGYLRYSVETFGVNLKLSSTPVYEWHLLGGGTENPRAGEPPTGTLALWNRTAQAYLVTGDETWGIGLKWYQVGDGSAPPVNNPPATMYNGIKTVVVLNCAHEQRPLEVFVQDMSTGAAFVDKGGMYTAWDGNLCPRAGAPTVTFDGLVQGHQYRLVTTDKGSDLCTSHLDDPTDAGCQRSVATFTAGGTNGLTLKDTVGIQIQVY
jgi:hypothetical protein